MIIQLIPHAACRVLATALAAAFAIATLALPAAHAQGVTDALSDFSMDSDEPVRIESDELEVRDRDRVAIFSGNVVVVQGETTMRTPRLEVHYTGQGAVAGAEQGDAPAQGISRLEARGGVEVVTRDQRATGEWAVFEMASQEITLGGNVVLTQGENVLRGASLIVNLESGSSRLVSSGEAGGGRVQGLFIPGGMGQKQD